MLTYTYISKGKFGLVEKPKPTIQHERDAIVKVTLASICSSDLHIKHGSVPRAVEGITVGHEMVGVVEQVGSAVTHVKPGDRVTVNVETFCGECFFCKKGFVNNCTDRNGGWALGCRIDGGQAEYVRVPFADQGLNKIPDTVTDRQALLVGDVLATGYWAAKISEITEDDTVLIIGAGPTGICALEEVGEEYIERVIWAIKDDDGYYSMRRFFTSNYAIVMNDESAINPNHFFYSKKDFFKENLLELKKKHTFAVKYRGKKGEPKQSYICPRRNGKFGIDMWGEEGCYYCRYCYMVAQTENESGKMYASYCCYPTQVRELCEGHPGYECPQVDVYEI